MHINIFYMINVPQILAVCLYAYRWFSWILCTN